MAIRFDTSGDYLERTTNLINNNNNYTAMGWFYISTDTNATAALMSFRASNSYYDVIVLGTDGTTLISEVRNAGSVTTSTGTNLSIGTWYHITAVRSSSTLLTVYLDEVSDSTNAEDVTSRGNPSVSQKVGYFDSSNPLPFNGRCYGLKYWDTDLSLSEIQIERCSILPKTKLSNVNTFTPCMKGAGERLRDYSPNADDWSALGTLTDENPPPVSWGNSAQIIPFVSAVAAGGRIMSSMANNGGLAGMGGIAGQGGGLAG